MFVKNSCECEYCDGWECAPCTESQNISEIVLDNHNHLCWLCGVYTPRTGFLNSCDDCILLFLDDQTKFMLTVHQKYFYNDLVETSGLSVDDEIKQELQKQIKETLQ